MADKLALLLEAEKRGLLPPDKMALLDEAKKRGLIHDDSYVHPDDIAAAPVTVPTDVNPMASQYVKPPEQTTTAADFQQGANPPIDPNAHESAAQDISGLHEGVAATLSLPNTLVHPFLALGPTVVNALTGSNFSTDTSYLPDAGKSYLAAVGPQGLNDVKPPDDNPANQFGRKVSQYLGASILPAAGALGSGVAAGTVARDLASATGAGVGAATAAAVAPGNPWAELAGSILGGASPGAVSTAARKVITPNPADAGRVAMAGTLKGEGVDLTAGQITGSKALQYAESELGGAATKTFMEKQSKQFAQAALQKAGVNANAATPAVMDKALTDIGDEFTHLSAQTSTPLDAKLQNDALAVVDNYEASAATPAKAVQNIVNRMGELAAKNNGVLTGEAYQELRSKIGTMSQGADSSTKIALRSLQNVLDDAVERNLPLGSPLVQDWRAARGQYRNLLVIQQAASAAGPSAAMGAISPAQLASAAKMIEGKRNWVRGKGDMDELARAGVAIMTPLPDSGTAGRLAAKSIASIPATIGGFVGSGAGLPGMVGGAVVGGAVPWALGRAMLSGAGRGYLSNQRMLPGEMASPGIALSAQAAMATSPNVPLVRQLQNYLPGAGKPLELLMRGALSGH